MKAANRATLAVAASAVLALGAGRSAGEVVLRPVAGAVEVRFGEEVFTRYNHADAGRADPIRPYLFPVFAAGGASVTSDQSAAGGDHRHHRSIWVGHGDVNGADHWETAGSGPGVPVQRSLAPPRAEGDSVVHDLEWTDGSGAAVMRERRTMRFFELAGGSRGIDLKSEYSALEKPVSFGDTKEAGLCAVRVSGAISADSAILNSGGMRGETWCWGRPAEWCDISGETGSGTCGVTVMDHPGNPRHPSRWHVRGYGLLAANMFGLKHFLKGSAGVDGSYVIPAGGTATFLYRVIVHRGAASAEETAVLYDDFAGGGDPGFEDLLSGAGGEGWRVPRPNLWWEFPEGAVTGTSDPDRRGNELYTVRKYRDLILDFEFRFAGEIDSGVFLRDGDKLQVQIGVSRSLKRDMTGSIYAGGYPGRAEGAAKALRPGEWNRMRIIGRGSRWRVWLNSRKVLDFWDPRFREAAPIGLQIHGGLDMKVEFRNMRVKSLD